jgi:hypothetical protein
VASGIISSNASGHAADTQAAAANNAAQLQHEDAQAALQFEEQQYLNSQQNIAPWLRTGSAAEYSLANLMGLRLPPPSTPPSTTTNLPNLGVTSPGNPFAGNVNASDLNPGGLSPRFAPAIDGAGFGGDFSPRFSRLSTFMGGDGAAAQPFNGNAQPPATFQNPDIGVWPGLNNGGNTIVANGGPAVVPRTDGGAFPGNPDAHNFGGGVPSDPNSPANANAPGAGGGAGDFGSLLQPFGETFVAPTDVTEQNDPGFKFRMQQGSDALERSAAARGGLLSGGTAKALADYNQNAASNEYQNVYNRAAQEFERRYNIYNQDQTTKFNRLSALAGGGQTAAQNLNSAGLATAGDVNSTLLTSGAQIGNDLNLAGGARASGYVGGANAITGAIGTGTNSLMDAFLLSQLGRNPSTSSTVGNGVI